MGSGSRCWVGVPFTTGWVEAPFSMMGVEENDSVEDSNSQGHVNPRVSFN